MYNFEDKKIEKEWLIAKEIIKKTGLISSNDDGGVNQGDQRALFYLARYFNSKKTLEIGTHLGCSTIALSLATDGIVYTVDKKDVNDADGPWYKMKKKFPPNVSLQLNGILNVIFNVKDSHEFLIKPYTYDLILIDGSHREKDVQLDIMLSLDRLNPDGAIILHDYYPNGENIWKEKPIIKGPYEACKNLGIEPKALIELPWETKFKTNKTSLAIIYG